MLGESRSVYHRKRSKFWDILSTSVVCHDSIIKACAWKCNKKKNENVIKIVNGINLTGFQDEQSALYMKLHSLNTGLYNKDAIKKKMEEIWWVFLSLNKIDKYAGWVVEHLHDGGTNQQTDINGSAIQYILSVLTVLSKRIWVINHITVGFFAFLCSVLVW